MAINFDFLEPAVLTGYIRELPVPLGLTLNQFLPDRTIADIEVAIDQITRTNRAAKFRAYDGENVIGKRDSFSRSRVALPPLGQKTMVGELERIQLEVARNNSDSRSRTVELIYDDADVNTRAIYNRMELARGDVLTDGKLTLTNENGLTLEADYGIDPTHLVTAPTVWSDHSNSDPIEDMLGWTETYSNDAGERPGVQVMTRATIGHLLRNDSIRSLGATLAGTPGVITRAALDNILDQYDLPRIAQYDAQIDVDGVATRPIPADRVIYLPANPATLGYTVWGITGQGLALTQGSNPQLTFQQAPGLVGIVETSGDALRIWTSVSAVGMPVIADPRRLMVADVL